MPGSSPAWEASPQGKVLVASPRRQFRSKVLQFLAPEAAPITEARGGAETLLKLEESDFHTLVLDRQIRDLDLEELLATIRARFPQLNVVVTEQEEQVGRAIVSWPENSSGSGGLDAYPPETSLLAQAARAVWGNCSRNGAAMPCAAAGSQTLPGMIGTSRKMREVYHLARLVAPRETAVLLTGASGTGKELVARGIHMLSRRSQGRFVVVNCAAIPESLLEAELFGFSRGAFTGAVQSQTGRVHAAHGGTLLLDEIGELPLSMQVKLLRFVQEGEVQRLGGADPFRVDVRLLAATNADLRQRVRQGQFREDLYYRLAVFPLELPPLRERPEDVLPLAQHFLAEFCRQAGAEQKVLGPVAANLLRRYSWPGNVRELRHAVERAFVLADGQGLIQPEHLAISLEAT